jgi:hypothetical protein
MVPDDKRIGPGVITSRDPAQRHLADHDVAEPGAGRDRELVIFVIGHGRSPVIVSRPWRASAAGESSDRKNELFASEGCCNSVSLEGIREAQALEGIFSRKSRDEFRSAGCHHTDFDNIICGTEFVAILATIEIADSIVSA